MLIGGPSGDGLHYTGNSTITGGANNPFLAGAGLTTFTITIPGLSSDIYADSAFFSFGPVEGDNVVAQCILSCLPPRVPEPSSLLLVGAGVVALTGFGWRIRRPRK